MTDPIIQSITDASLLTARAHHAGYGAGYADGKALLRSARAEILDLIPASATSDREIGRYEAFCEALKIMDNVIAATDGEGQ